MLSSGRLPLEDVETGAAEPSLPERINQRLLVDEPPREVLTRTAPSRIEKMRRRSSRWRVSGVSGTWSETTSLEAQLVERSGRAPDDSISASLTNGSCT